MESFRCNQEIKKVNLNNSLNWLNCEETIRRNFLGKWYFISTATLFLDVRVFLFTGTFWTEKNTFRYHLIQWYLLVCLFSRNVAELGSVRGLEIQFCENSMRRKVNSVNVTSRFNSIQMHFASKRNLISICKWISANNIQNSEEKWRVEMGFMFHIGN